MSAAVILAIVQGLLTYGPSTAMQLVALFQKKPEEITPADWTALFAVAEKSYEDYVGKPKVPITGPTGPKPVA